MKPKELIKMLQKEGWIIKNQRGSHVHMIHPSKPGKIQIPYHNKDLKPKTLNSILK
ncbi:toxin-antitoxin system, toxin component, HicA family protein [Thermoanaerobacterium thermosaccharolyticum]|jgi:predicted RNA binding protein YcfA (HicA-like mRNA interferase family)|uniref:Toxin-antitoxin system, toxin component, HicA family protein n=3 Tax=Thermoanaerobacteraceae TaxID=186814 RepID=A0A231VME1_THETR|nr:type II toxin-antitoxin system HicA family toxin [Thermoanaerobacterium thermosaccharolyticum]AST58470.1 YcfA family protein [Thermoanaerobacterium thermosaccharolyticum]OXT09452.1 toxin-antitoxin system, toxin component, HicA family protein [Thermoanaerobacterium thermosaccharolyticum]PHO08165.1 toxin-antitoxin system, toxin component, HicA family protein [Thermoanaerobacterium thermosaccharolyticum]